ncbi:MAG: ATP-binding protein [Microcoleaceae cyanobacterium]
MNSDTNGWLSSSTSAQVWQGLGAELVFTQNASGEYLSFYWQQGRQYHLSESEVVGYTIGETIGPMLIPPYLERIRRVLKNLIPERFSYPFCYQNQYFPLDLIVSPILQGNGEATQVLVMGRVLQQQDVDLTADWEDIVAYRSLPSNFDIQQKMLVQIAGTLCRTVPPSSQIYQILLSQIAQKIRRTLDLKQIWQQTVNSLGQVLRVSRCILCPYQQSSHRLPHSQKTQVVAEYRQRQVSMMLGLDLSIQQELGWTQALATLEPVVIEHTSNIDDPYERQSVLVIPTAYQEIPNALICLHQCDELRQWTIAEIDFVRELATQVGTAIAHATLYQELKEAQAEAVALSRLKSEFLASTSHELRTPLNGIIGSLKLVLDDMVDDPEEEREFIQEAHRAAIHLLSLINDVLDIAKIEAGKMEIQLALVKVADLLEEVEKFTRTQIQQKGLTLTVQTPPSQDEIIVYANSQRLLQVLLNLVGNAIKFTHEGGVSISLAILPGKVVVNNQQLPGFVEFRVVDTGIGVPIAKQDRLFKAFSQVDTGYTRQYGGTGLGLVISQKLVQAMGGTVRFYSLGEGLGSTVTFTVPLYQEPGKAKIGRPNRSDIVDNSQSV